MIESKWYWNYDRSTLKNPFFIDQITSISISYSFLQKNSDIVFKLPKNILMRELLLNSGLFEINKITAHFFVENAIFLAPNIKTYLKIEASYICDKEPEIDDKNDFFLLLPIIIRFLFFLEHFFTSLNEPPILQIEDGKKRDILLNFIDKLLEIFTKSISFWQVNTILSFSFTHKAYRQMRCLHPKRKI